MKKIIFICIILILNSCSKTIIKEPNEIGMQVFSVLQKISVTSKNDYVNNFINIDEIRELGKNEKVITDEHFRNQFTQVLKADWENLILEDYNQIKKNGIDYGINWKEIEYLDYIYEIRMKDGGKMCYGELYFKYKSDTYKIYTRSLFDGIGFKLIKIDGYFNLK